MDTMETVYVAEATVRCDGGILGHPAVFLHLGEDGRAMCPYCSRQFIMTEGAQPASGH